MKKGRLAYLIIIIKLGHSLKDYWRHLCTNNNNLLTIIQVSILKRIPRLQKLIKIMTENQP